MGRGAAHPLGLPSAPPPPDRASLLALILLGASGLTAGVALLPMRAHGREGAVGFIERHRLELAGVSTSCLLVALLVFAGLI